VHLFGFTSRSMTWAFAFSQIELLFHQQRFGHVREENIRSLASRVQFAMDRDSLVVQVSMTRCSYSLGM
jgi:hypothetical protein